MYHAFAASWFGAKMKRFDAREDGPFEFFTRGKVLVLPRAAVMALAQLQLDRTQAMLRAGEAAKNC